MRKFVIMAVGVLFCYAIRNVVKHTQHKRSKSQMKEEINRWEGEGGNHVDKNPIAVS